MSKANFTVRKERGEKVLKQYDGPIESTLIIPEGISKIASDAFDSCWIVARDVVNRVVLPHSLKRISDVFSNWRNLKYIEIPDGVISIADKAFQGTSLCEITIPSSVERIGKNAFGKCKELKKVTLLHLSAKILNSFLCEEYFTFDNEIPQLKFDLTFGKTDGIALTNIYRNYDIYEPNTKFSISNWCIMYGKDVVYYCGKDAAVYIPENADRIAPKSFLGNNTIKSVKMNKRLKRIGSCAFEGCQELRHIELNDALEYIGSYAFYCTALEAVTIPHNVRNVGQGAFYGCFSLTNITVREVIGSSNSYSWHAYWKAGCFASVSREYIF